jgi:type I restriction enzyme M protein
VVKKAASEKEEPIEKQLWKAADKLRKDIAAAEYFCRTFRNWRPRRC